MLCVLYRELHVLSVACCVLMFVVILLLFTVVDAVELVLFQRLKHVCAGTSTLSAPPPPILSSRLVVTLLLLFLRQVGDIDSYRVVLIFKDPAEALVSRFFYNHCKNLRGADCGGSEKAFPSLER